jgi:charged multivesicular body protein 1
MEKFESQFSDLDVQTNYMEETMSNTTAVSTPQDQIDSLMKQAAEEADIELEHDLAAKDLRSLPDLAAKEKSTVGEEDLMLAERLRALRPST